MVNSSKNFINCRGKLIDLSTPKVMGILNITENSFFDGGNYTNEKGILNHTEKMLSEGADFIDVGAVSTKPKSIPPSVKEEIIKLTRAINLLRKHFPNCIISADTYRSGVAKEAVEAGADMINDIGGGTLDDEMFEAIAKLNVPYILMHIQKTPFDMQENPKYNDVFKDVLDYFALKCKELKDNGVKDIIIDPGFGFGKNTEHNYALLKRLSDFRMLGFPILAGVSRKSIVNKVLETKPEEALNGTTVLNTIALLNGASILRVHDVKEAVETIKLTGYYTSV